MVSGGRSGPRILSLLLSALVAVVIGATAGLAIWHSRETAREEHLRGMDSMGIVLAEQTGRYVQVIDVMLQEVQSRIAGLNIATQADFQAQLQTPDISAYLADRVKTVPQVGNIDVIDASARVVNWALSKPVRSVDVTDRDYYRHLKDHDDPGIFVGAMAISRSMGRPTLFFAHRINGPGGQFLGLVVAVVDVRYLTDFYQASGEHVRQSVTLLRSDGTLLLHYPDPETAMGATLPQTSPWYALVATGGGSYVTAAGLSGALRLISVHPLADYKLVVNVVMTDADVYAGARREALFIVTLALLAELAFAILFWMLERQFRRQAEQNVRLADAAARLTVGQDILRAYTAMSTDWLWEQDQDFRYLSQPGFPAMGTQDDTGKRGWDVGDPAMSAERRAAHQADLLARRPFRDFRWERIGADGVRRCFSTNGDPVFDRDGAFTGYRGTGRDITAEVEASARLAQANADLERERERFAAVLNNITQGVVFFDGDQRLLLSNRRYSEIYGLPAEATRIGCTLA